MAMNRMFLREVERNETLVRVARATDAQREDLISEYQSRWEAAYSPSTLRNYRQSIKLFSAWCLENGHDARPPISPSVLALYVDYLGGKVRASTIINRLTAIGEYHRAQFHVSPARHRLVELAVRAVKRKYGCALRQAPALGKKEVLEILSRMGTSRKDIRDKALLWVASDSWCRASELVAFRVRDMVRQDDGSSLLFVTRSKTDPFGEGAYSYLSRRGTNAVLDWVRMAGLKSDEPIFIKSWKNGRRQGDPSLERLEDLQEALRPRRCLGAQHPGRRRSGRLSVSGATSRRSWSPGAGCHRRCRRSTAVGSLRVSRRRRRCVRPSRTPPQTHWEGRQWTPKRMKRLTRRVDRELHPLNRADL
jgi:site-specific recombinase XerC